MSDESQNPKYKHEHKEDPNPNLESKCCGTSVQKLDEGIGYRCTGCDTECGAVLGLLVAVFAATLLGALLFIPATASAQQQCPGEGCIKINEAEKCLKYARKWDKLTEESLSCEARVNQVEGQLAECKANSQLWRQRAQTNANARDEQKRRADRRHSTFWMLVSNAISATGGFGLGFIYPN